MRIIGGIYRGTRLAGPGRDGRGEARLRPTSDRVREALFNLLEHGIGWEPARARVLDLFAGTGALGLEALSRGAARAVFVDEGAAARALIRRNVEALGVIGQAKIWRRDATRLGPCRGTPFDLVFADPPYRSGLGPRALASALEGGWIAPGGLVVLELAAGEAEPAIGGMDVLDARRYGDTRIMIMRRKETA
jgi:16S rRNA (guanine966-N2)-methyltransferase